MYDYGSAEDNMKHYGVVSERVCWEGVESVGYVGRWGECRVCVGRLVVSAGCVW